MENHETDHQRARRQRSEVKKHGITGSTPSEATKRIKEHVANKMKRENVAGKPNALKRLFDSLPERDKRRE